MRRRGICTAVALTATLAAIAAQAQTSPKIPQVPVLPPAEEAALAASAAPAHISENATIYLKTARGLEVWREGKNGYSCLVERFTTDSTVWPTCYDADASRLFIPKNRLLEEYRAAGKTGEQFRDAFQKALDKGEIPVPKGGGISYRLSPEAYTTGRDGNRIPGIWMIMISTPFSDARAAGVTPENAEAWTGVQPTFGYTSPGRADSYFWTRVTALPGTASPAGEYQPARRPSS